MLLRNIMIVMVFLFLSGCDEVRLPSPFHAAEVRAKFTQADFRLTDITASPANWPIFAAKSW